MKINKKRLIRFGIAISVVWALIVTGVAYLQYELLSGGDVGVSLTQPDHHYARKHYWFFDLYSQLIKVEETRSSTSGVDLYSDKKAVPFEGELAPIDESEAQRNVDNLLPIKVLVLNVSRFLFTYLGPLILIWAAGMLLAWALSGGNDAESEKILLPQTAAKCTESDTPTENEIDASKALSFNGAEENKLKLIQPTPTNHEFDSIQKDEDKKQKSWALIALHVWGGVCLNAVFNLGKIHLGALPTVGAVILGYVGSKHLVAQIDALELTNKVRTMLIISLVPLYFILLIALGVIIRIVRGIPL